jgi:hypothetical protein
MTTLTEAAEMLRSAVWTVTPPRTKADLHLFRPHRKYPWFCAHCGYGPGEPLKHVQEIIAGDDPR